MDKEPKVKRAEISQLLKEAADAHHEFETTVLDGVYDEDWAHWYAEHLLEHGLNEVLARPISVEDLSNFLVNSNKRFERTDIEQPWPEFTATALLAHVE